MLSSEPLICFVILSAAKDLPSSHGLPEQIPRRVAPRDDRVRGYERVRVMRERGPEVGEASLLRSGSRREESPRGEESTRRPRDGQLACPLCFGSRRE